MGYQLGRDIVLIVFFLIGEIIVCLCVDKDDFMLMGMIQQIGKIDEQKGENC